MNLDTIKYIARNPESLFMMLGSKGLLNWIPDNVYVYIYSSLSLGYSVNLKKPQTFNEKMQWLKLYDRNSVYTELADKYEVRKHIAKKIGEEYLIPLVGGPWKSVEEIDFSALPNQFVLKTTHDSGGIVFCKDKNNFDIERAKEKLKKHLRRKYYYGKREWPYKGINPQIVAEQYMKDGESENLTVYKIFCFGGEPKIIQTIQNDKTKDESIDYFSPDWTLLDMRQNFPNSDTPMAKPEKLEEMLAIAKSLSEGFPFIRTDLYSINNNVYFSELTFYSDSGSAAFDPPEWDRILGSWIKLPDKKMG